MTNLEFKAWRQAMGLTQQGAAEALGISRGAVENYEAGKRRESDRAVVVPRPIGLACAAVTAGLDEWKSA